MPFQLVVLGSGQDGGTPQLGQSVTSVSRTASSIAVIGEDRCLLFDVSPDVRLQTAALSWSSTAIRRPFDAIFITHAHMGHYAGLVHFGRESIDADRIPVHASASVLGFLTSNEPWSSLFHNGNLVAEPMVDAVAFGRLTVARIPVPHRSEFSDASAFSILVDDDPWALYLPDIDSWDEWPQAEDVIGRHSVAVVDATFGEPDELPGRDLTEIPHPLVRHTVDRFGHLTEDSTVVLSHINHSNALNDDASDLRRQVLDAGFLVASDGLVLDGPR